jgi:hypothetical protein
VDFVPRDAFGDETDTTLALLCSAVCSLLRADPNAVHAVYVGRT